MESVKPIFSHPPVAWHKKEYELEEVFLVTIHDSYRKNSVEKILIRKNEILKIEEYRNDILLSDMEIFDDVLYFSKRRYSIPLIDKLVVKRKFATGYLTLTAEKMLYNYNVEINYN